MMKLQTFNQNRMGQNIYLYFDEVSGEGVLVDAGCSNADMQLFEAFIMENNITVKAILLTHGHYDHIIAADELKKITAAPLCCHEAEKDMLANPAINLSVKIGKSVYITPERLLSDGDLIQIGNTALKTIHTPGHTPGGVCYYDETNGNLFSGDTLFKESIGRTDFPAGNHTELIRSITDKLLTLPAETKVYPGHGPSTTIDYEKKYNPFVK